MIEQITEVTCLHCGSSRIKKDGKRKTSFGYTQRYKCKACKKKFSWNLGFAGRKYKAELITLALQMYFSGQSLRSVCKTLKMMGISPTHQTVWNWIDDFSRLLSTFLLNYKPDVGDSWRSDEMFVHVKGEMKYVFAMMDDKTRFMLAQQLADSKFKHDATFLFRMGKLMGGKNPKVVTTDGLPAYQSAFNRVFYTNETPRTKHVCTIKLAGDMNNNMMERLNCTMRDREKTFRGLQSINTPIFNGFQIFYNYIRTHEGLKGITPAEAAGIDIQGDNKWLTLIRRATLEK